MIMQEVIVTLDVIEMFSPIHWKIQSNSQHVLYFEKLWLKIKPP